MQEYSVYMSKKQKKLIIVRGPICAGKSSVAQILRDSMPNASWVEYDVMKSMIDHKNSSSWRHKLAFHTAVSLAEDLMDAKRTIVMDVHSSSVYQYTELKKLAEAHRYEFKSILLMPPLAICLRRSKLRNWENISEKKIREYWHSSFRIEDEPVFDSSQLSSEEIAAATLALIGANQEAVRDVADIV
jgi:predicted kinase